MKLKNKIPKIRENYYIRVNLIEELEKLSKKTGYTKTDLIEIAIQNLIKENESDRI